ncbi:unnamed protein product [Toxocara canis]|uniref:Transposase n=1 Tax=Toxocara canis TaxID=6265 RepID=A0A183VDZ2_TOXCA|nr:unnamed protein product [Toxocara canis]
MTTDTPLCYALLFMSGRLFSLKVGSVDDDYKTVLNVFGLEHRRIHFFKGSNGYGALYVCKATAKHACNGKLS